MRYTRLKTCTTKTLSIIRTEGTHFPELGSVDGEYLMIKFKAERRYEGMQRLARAPQLLTGLSLDKDF